MLLLPLMCTPSKLLLLGSLLTFSEFVLVVKNVNHQVHKNRRRSVIGPIRPSFKGRRFFKKKPKSAFLFITAKTKRNDVRFENKSE